MTDAAVVGRILREYRPGPPPVPGPASVRRRYGSVRGPRVGYRIEWPGGAPVLVRAYRADLPPPARLGGAGTAPVTDWLLGRAATLQWLALRGYPAPRVVTTRSGDPVRVAGAWLTWATSCVAGRALAPGGGQAGALGAALGRLHALGAPERGAVGLASWHPGTAIPPALRRLRAVAALLPADWRPLHEARWRRLDDAERAVLADGIRFGAACAGAAHFERALIDGAHGAVMDARLGRLRDRVAVSQAVAGLAARHLAAR